MGLRRCIQCGNEFAPSRGNNTVCSRKCILARRAAQNRLGPHGMKKRCAWCGREFSTTHSVKMACSEACARERRNMRLRQWHDARRKQKIEKARAGIDRIIGESQTPISDYDAWRILQGRSSAKKVRTRMELQVRKKICAHCGKIFSTAARKKPACSRECAEAMRA